MVPFLTLQLVAAPAEGSTAGFGRLEGVVTSPVDGRGLPNVLVIVRPAPSWSGGGASGAGGMRTLPNPEAGGDATVEGRVDTTDRDGTFSFDELPPGLYSLDVIGERPVGDRAPSEVPQRVWTQVSSVIVVPGLTATERVTLLAPQELPPSRPTIPVAPGT